MDATIQEDLDMLRLCLESVIGDAIAITLDTKIETFGFDSLDIKELGFSIEEDFGIENADSLEITNDTTVGDLLAQVRRLRDG
jgi:acyl carrier protein